MSSEAVALLQGTQGGTITLEAGSRCHWHRVHAVSTELQLGLNITKQHKTSRIQACKSAFHPTVHDMLEFWFMRTVCIMESCFACMCQQTTTTTTTTWHNTYRCAHRCTTANLLSIIFHVCIDASSLSNIRQRDMQPLDRHSMSPAGKQYCCAALTLTSPCTQLAPGWLERLSGQGCSTMFALHLPADAHDSCACGCFRIWPAAKDTKWQISKRQDVELPQVARGCPE